MSSRTKKMTGEQLLLARVLGRMDTRMIAAELDHRALMGAQDDYDNVLESLRPLRPRRAQSKPVLGTAA